MRYYFDHNACTPIDPRVLERFREVELDCPGNPGSLHTSGRRSRRVVEDARDQVAALLGATPDQVVFVSGGTEANNLAVQHSGNPALPVLCAPVEHPSSLQSAAHRGLEIWEVDATGAAQVREPIGAVGLIALVHGQNELGTLQPIREAAALAEHLGVPLHVDASQTLGRCALDEVLRVATTLTLSTHKAGGIRGMGLLIDRGAVTQPLFFGGAQQGALRPGTESPSLAAATALTVELALGEWSQRATAMRAARAAFEAELKVNGARRLTPALGSRPESLPNTVMLQFAGVDGRELLPALDMVGVEASQGSACSSGSPLPPPILSAIGLDDATARTCVRFSFAASTAATDATAGAVLVDQVLERLRRR